MGQQVAVKFFHATLNPENAFKEIKVMFELRHPYIVGIAGWFMQAQGNRVGIIIELCEKGELLTCYKQDWFTNLIGIDILSGCALALSYMHSFPKPIVHRDLKTTNILVTGELTGKIADCGESRRVTTDYTMTQVGTPLYAAPEILRGDRYDESVDVYSFGVVLSEVMSRELPFSDIPKKDRTGFNSKLFRRIKSGEQKIRNDKEWDKRIRALIKRCTKFHPRKRPAFPKVAGELLSIVKKKKQKVEGEDGTGKETESGDGTDGADADADANADADADANSAGDGADDGADAISSDADSADADTDTVTGASGEDSKDKKGELEGDADAGQEAKENDDEEGAKAKAEKAEERGNDKENSGVEMQGTAEKGDADDVRGSNVPAGEYSAEASAAKLDDEGGPAAGRHGDGESLISNGEGDDQAAAAPAPESSVGDMGSSPNIEREASETKVVGDVPISHDDAAETGQDEAVIEGGEEAIEDSTAVQGTDHDKKEVEAMEGNCGGEYEEDDSASTGNIVSAEASDEDGRASVEQGAEAESEEKEANSGKAQAQARAAEPLEP